MTDIHKNSNCITCDTDCNNPNCIRHDIPDYVIDNMPDEVRDFYLSGYHNSLYDEVKYHCGKMLGLVGKG